MSAAQRTGRSCSCGCGASLDDMGPTAKWARGCNATKSRTRAAKRKWEEKRQRNRTAHQYPTFVCKLPNGQVRAPRIPLACKLCCDDPSNRSPEREADSESGDGDSLRFVGFEMLGRWACRGCGELYAPEPPPERISLYHSSAAIAVDHGVLHGYQGAIAKQGDVSLYPRKANRK